MSGLVLPGWDWLEVLIPQRLLKLEIIDNPSLPPWVCISKSRCLSTEGKALDLRGNALTSTRHFVVVDPPTIPA